SIAAEHPLTTVRAAVLTSQDYVGSVTIRGQTQAIRKVELRSEIDAQIVKLPVEKGGRVKEGDLICQLSVDDRQARLQEAEALARQRELEASAAKRLAEKGHRSATQTAAAMAQYDAAKAQVMQIEIELENTKIRAPFGGILNERPVEIGAYLQKGDSCATLVEEDPYLVIGNVSEQDVGSLSVGDIGFATLATGQTMEGKIRYISAVANETTRTFKVELIVANSDRTLRDGITTVITVPRPAAQAHLLSPAFLTLDDSGQIGVRVLNSDNIVAFRPVTIVGNNESGVWIRGLSEQETVITVGHEFVRAGQKVNVDNGLGGNT
ncbi:MAG: efflux RND transporter periplasmic adaptor subunit, partial [Proteobacteria bacterium]|nr:efflux RND transporter periplasmic adaptor subunit [Pseudomonadota bacterium]